MKTFKLLLITSLLLSLTGCEEKKSDLPKKKVEKHEQVQSQKENNSSENNATEEKDFIEPIYTFNISNINDVNHTVTIENKDINISNVSERIIVLNFFATWCPPCQGQLPYLVDLQKKYEGKLFIAGLLVNDTPDKEALESFLKEYGVDYFVASSSQNDDLAQLAIEKLHLPKDLPIPITVLFKDGHYYSHYEGAVPVEMLEHDIKNALNKE